MTTPDLPSPAEAPVWLELNGSRVCTWLCTPADLDALACGWLIGTGRIRDRHDVLLLEVRRREGFVRVRTATGEAAGAATGPISLSAGPGEAGFAADRIPAGPARAIPDPRRLIDSGDLRAAFQEMFRGCALRAEGGGVHSGALLCDAGVVHVTEDVGRHNLLDKLIGAAALAEMSLDDVVALITGRVSAEIAVKAWRAGLGGIATLSVPTSLARQVASRAGLWLIGRSLRGSPFVYEPGGGDAR